MAAHLLPSAHKTNTIVNDIMGKTDIFTLAWRLKDDLTKMRRAVEEETLEKIVFSASRRLCWIESDFLLFYYYPSSSGFQNKIFNYETFERARKRSRGGEPPFSRILRMS